MKSTPRPWTYFHDSCAQCEKEGTAEFVIMEPPGGRHGQFSNEADAALIVRAVNAHDDLVAALDEAAAFFNEQIDADINFHISSGFHHLSREERRAELIKNEGSARAIADLEEHLACVNAALAKARGEP